MTAHAIHPIHADDADAAMHVPDAAAADGYIDAIESEAGHHRTDCGDGVHMAWRRWGNGAPVVLLHGGAGSWLHWIRNIRELAVFRTVWVPDLPGFGDSALPAGAHDADTLAPMVSSGIDALIGNERFDLVGFSFGGLVAGYIAAGQPSNLDTLTLVGVAGLGIVGATPALKSMRGVDDPAARRDIVRWNLHQMMIADARRIDDLAITVQQRSAPRDRVKNRTLALRDPMLALAPRWRARIAGVWGTGDVLYRDQLPALRAAIDLLGITDATLIEGAGHWLQYECANTFNAFLADRLGGPSRASTGEAATL